MKRNHYDLFNEISVTEAEIDEWIKREVPHMSELKSRRDYYAR